MLIIDGDIIVHRAGALDFHQAAFGIISIGDGLGCNDGADHQQPRSHSRQYPTSSHAHAPVAEIKRIETRKYCLDESYWTRPIASTPHTIIRTKLAAFLLFAKSTQQSCGRFYYPRVSTSTVQRTRSEEHTSELQSLMRISYAVFCLKKKKQ